MKRTKSSQQWLKEHFDDHYVKAAQKEGYRSRAAYKLQEIQEKDLLFKPGMFVVDLGAAPGSWSQVVSEYIGPSGKIVALDLLEMGGLGGVEFLQGDFRDEEIQERLHILLKQKPLDWVLSDMAPNMTGNREIDIPRSMGLVEEVVQFASEVLAPGGGLLTKVFQGSGFEAVVKELRGLFDKVVMRKPDASRARSNECFLLAKGFKG